MSPVRNGLVFLLVGLLVAIFFVSPLSQRSSLFAQEPSATPTSFPDWDDIPYCPPVTENPSSSEATPLPSANAPICRATGVVFSDEGPYSENPSEVTQEPSDSQSDATPIAPTPTAPVASLEAADIPNQTHKLYLPSAHDGQPSTSESANTDGEVIYSEYLNHPYIPIDQLPECPDVPPFDLENLPLPDPNAPQCRVKSTFSDMSELILQGVDISKLGFSIDPPMIRPSTVLASGVSAPDGTFNYAWAQHDLAVPSGQPVITSILGVVSAMNPSLPAGKSWNDFHYFNRLQLGSSTTSYCGQLSKFSVGVGRGYVGGIANPTPTLIWEEYNGSYCGVFTTTINVTNSITVQIVKIGTNRYLGQAWLGYWYLMFDRTVSWSVDGGTKAAAGHQYWTVAGDKASMSVPTNFTSQLQLNGKPWANVVGPVGWSGYTTTFTDSPFAVLDSTSGTYTSISVKAN